MALTNRTNFLYKNKNKEQYHKTKTQYTKQTTKQQSQGRLLVKEIRELVKEISTNFYSSVGHLLTFSMLEEL